MKISKHFWQKEFDCKCGCKTDVIVHSSLLSLLEKIRVALDAPIRITSGGRCEEHNQKVGGSKKSWHIPRPGNGILYASDISYWRDNASISKMDTLKLYTLANVNHAQGLGLYPGRIHVDTRPTKARALWIDNPTWRWD
jgi:hypothetical protein